MFVADTWIGDNQIDTYCVLLVPHLSQDSNIIDITLWHKQAQCHYTNFNFNYCFLCLTATTAERFFRIDRAQEHLHYVTDISSEDLYILDPELRTSFMGGHRQSNGSLIGVTVSPSLDLCTSSGVVSPRSDIRYVDT